MRHGAGRLGALDLYRGTVGPLDPHDLASAQTLADVVSAYLLNAQAREQVLLAVEEMRDVALHDALTGLANRTLLRDRLEQAAARFARVSAMTAVLYVDLDHFKRVNDTYGHFLGDRLLIAVAQRLSALVRPSDTLARVSGDEFVVVAARHAEEARHRDDLEQDLREALAGSALEVVYQPIVSVPDGLVTGVEALLRWTHPAAGPVPPLTTVSVAERTGLILDLGAWVLERSCRDCVRWLVEFDHQPLDMSVNVSARQLAMPDFATTVADILEATGMDPARLVLEVTEGIFIEDASTASTVLTSLKHLGVRVALDDFGTGYSSLGYLRRFPVDIVKIDQTFVADIGRDSAAAGIVAAILQLAGALGLRATAEGVENDQQSTQLFNMGCRSAQGYHFARPMSRDNLSLQLVSAGGQPLRMPQRAG